jgi:hypothetical protein
MSGPAVGPTQPLIQWVPGALFLGVKLLGREVDHPPPTGAVPPLPNTSSWRGAWSSIGTTLPLPFTQALEKLLQCVNVHTASVTLQGFIIYFHGNKVFRAVTILFFSLKISHNVSRISFKVQRHIELWALALRPSCLCNGEAFRPAFGRY